MAKKKVERIHAWQPLSGKACVIVDRGALKAPYRPGIASMGRLHRVLSDAAYRGECWVTPHHDDLGSVGWVAYPSNPILPPTQEVSETLTQALIEMREQFKDGASLAAVVSELKGM